ncbi:MAG: hypothetical protein DRR16_20145 [Candidatus Parabeggiatoa sp. nov. 3]|nr:MAG: hypothetical protein DRR00_08885 [Gammaproteobacteria bacterium]RKZ67763.1 MAG: hypothetical protein DRQ99_05710 [Gammaproteobacteria bacterium]RKZ82238.1 MAG: hypothetical protein DRR16_20145 [Gammaproteobacteria bacterium]HEW98939.1 hypothetical protein [Beggiatoa sp.]
MINNPIILLNHPNQVRIVLESKLRIASALFPEEGVICMGGWISHDRYRFLSDLEAEPLIQENPFELVSLITEAHRGLKVRKP